MFIPLSNYHRHCDDNGQTALLVVPPFLMPSILLSFWTYLSQYNTLPGVPPEKEAKMKVKLNTEVTVDILIDGVLVKKPISEIPGMTREQAEAINTVRADSDHLEELQADYDRHHRDKAVEGIRGAIQRGQSTDMTDPLDKIADPNADIFSTLYPARRKVSAMTEAVKQVIEELPESQKALFFKRYVLEMTFDAIADEEFLVTGVRVTKQAVSQRHQRMLAQVKKRLGQKVQIPF